MATLETVALCDQCAKPQTGDVLAFSTKSHFRFCPSCGSQDVQPEKAVVVRLSDPINRDPYGWVERIVVG